METFSFLIVLALIIQIEVSSQSSLPSGISSSTQANIDIFHPHYPNDTEIDCNMTNHTYYIDNITSLSLIESDC